MRDSRNAKVKQEKDPDLWAKIVLIVASILLSISYLSDGITAAKTDAMIPAIHGGYMGFTQAYLVSFGFGYVGLATLWNMLKK